MKVAVAGNPNCGKSTLFNELTGLNQRTGNFPGVTVERRSGTIRNTSGEKIELIDLPGAYSLFPKSMDEEITAKVLTDSRDPDCPDLVLVVVDGTSIRRGLHLLTQILDLGLPAVLAVNMVDLMKGRGIKLDFQYLQAVLRVPVIPVCARNADGLDVLLNTISSGKNSVGFSLWKEAVTDSSPLSSLSFPEFLKIEKSNAAAQVKDSVQRYRLIDQWLKVALDFDKNKRVSHPAEKIDRWLTHPFFGLGFFLFTQFLLFQFVFAFSEGPMSFIDEAFSSFSNFLSGFLPTGILSRLLCDGIIPGFAGVMIFIPQIAFLFAFIAIMEDTGYMARVSYMMDKLLRGFGLNGRSVIPLMGGIACAVPSVMGARTISSYKERLITVLVVPFMSCSARLPVYSLLISMVIPDKDFLGMNLRGFTLFALYMIGFLAALFAALLLKYMLKSKEKSFFVMELPVYRFPKWKQVSWIIFEKVKVFVLDAGKVIIAISVLLWFLSSFAPGEAFEKVESGVNEMLAAGQLNPNEKETELAKQKLEVSYAGILGHAIEPLISPLGFDWKIGIAIVTSFAAREVFVGTMSTLYAASDPDNMQSIRERMSAATHVETGLPVYTLRTGIGLMLFYAFAMQCMSTLAVVRRETSSWKWPVIQFVFMGILAWVSAFMVENF